MLLAVASAGLFARPVAAQTNGIFADFATSMGSFTVRLDEVRAPRATANFIGLATGVQAWRDPESGGIRTNRFYDGTGVHLIRYDDTSVPGTTNRMGFQGGLRPVRNAGGTSAWTGGPGYTILDETTNGLSHSNGVIAMVQSGPHTGASEYLITRTNAAGYWDGRQTVFGHVVSNMATVNAITAVPMVDGYPQTTVTVSSVTIRRVGAAAEAFDVAAWNLPQVVASETALSMGSGTNLSSVAYDVPPRSEYFIIHATNLLEPAWSFNSIGFNSKTQGFRATNTFLAQPGAFGPRHVFHAAQAQYPVFSAIDVGPGIQFAAQMIDGTIYQYQIDLRAAQGWCTGIWVSVSNGTPTGSGTLSGTYWATRTANTTWFNFMDNMGNVHDFKLGFDHAGDTEGRYQLDLYGFLWGEYRGTEFGACEYAAWSPGGAKALVGRSAATDSGGSTVLALEPGYNRSDWPLRSIRAPTGAIRAPGSRPAR